MRASPAIVLVVPGLVLAACAPFAAADEDAESDAAEAADAAGPADGGALPEAASPSTEPGCFTFAAPSPSWQRVEEGPDARIEYGINDGDRLVMRARASKQSNAALVHDLPTGAEGTFRVSAKIGSGTALVGTKPKFIEVSCASPQVSAFVFLEQQKLRRGTSDGFPDTGFDDVHPEALGTWATFELEISGTTATLRANAAAPVQAKARTSFSSAKSCKLAIGVRNGTELASAAAPGLEASFEAACFDTSSTRGDR